VYIFPIQGNVTVFLAMVWY